MTFRNYKYNSLQSEFYKKLYSQQKLEKVLNKYNKYSKFDKNIKYTMHHVLNQLNTYVDISDPDLDLPNLIHAYQTAERARLEYPENKELQITALIHDLGKILFSVNEKSYFIVGDTFILGCPNNNLVFNEYQPDIKYEYKNGCGIENLLISYGHDEFLYQVLKFNKHRHKLPEKYWNMIRYHSLYAWHTHGQYREYMNHEDYKILRDVQLLNSFDLYSKSDSIVISENTKTYYDDLLTEYFPEELVFF